MEKKSNLNETNLLIDLSSSPLPVKKHVLRAPLIPIPAFNTNQPSVSPTNNPFDTVAKQSVLTPDPFDILLENAQKQEKDSYTPHTNTAIVFSEMNNSFNYTFSQIKPVEIVANNCENSSLVITNEQRNCIKVDSANESVTVAEADSQSLNFCDISSEGDLKAIIAKRINRVVTKALNDSRPSSPTNSVENNEPKMTYMNRRSQSFITETIKNDKAEKLNKSFSHSQCPQFSKDFETVKSPDSSDWCLQKEASPNNDSVFSPADNELVFKEANKLARTFSKIAESFCHDAGSDNDEDLLSCKPRWLYADSSEDEEEKLRNDPALNVRVSLTPVTQSRKSEPSAKSSKKLSAFLKKAKRSLDLIHNKSSQDEVNIKSLEADREKKHIASASVIPPVVTVIPSADPATAALKLKKRATVEGKRGPMRAVMPVQSMTREAAPVKGKSKPLKPEVSPPWKKNSLLAMDTPKSSTNKLSMRPVACSTPNKPADLIPSPLPVVTGKTKRRSLGSSLLDNQMQRSRMSEAEGARQRSNSVTSKIPTVNIVSAAAANAYKGSSVKSASDLSRNTSVPLVNTQQNSKCKPSNLNVKHLRDVKTKSSPKGGIRSTVNAGFNHLASRLTGRKSQTNSRDKENKVPS